MREAPPLKAGDVLVPCRRARLLPLGVLSGAAYGLLALAPALVGVGLLKKPDAVLSSFHGDALEVWLYCILAWLALLGLNLAAGALVGRKRVLIGEDTATLRGAFGGEKTVAARGITHLLTVHSIPSLSATMVATYRDGRRVHLDTHALGDRDLGRFSAFLTRKRTPAGS